MDQKTYATLLKIYSVLGMISAFVLFVIGIVLLASTSFRNSLEGALSFILILVGVMLILVSFIIFYLYLSLFLRKAWSRYVISVLAVLSALGSLMSMPFGILSLFLEGFLAYLLLIDHKNAKSYFKKRR